jgi:uncharacterized membrane protein
MTASDTFVVVGA